MSCNHASTKEDTENKDSDDTFTSGENLISDFHKSLLSTPTPSFFPPTDPVHCYTIRLTQQEIQKAEKQITIPSNGESKPGI